MDLYCAVCKTMTCKLCLIGPHFDHHQQVEKAYSVPDQSKTHLSGWTKTYADNQLLAMRNAMQLINSKSESLKLKQAELIYRIRECERHISVVINRQFNQMVKEVVTAINEEHAKLTRTKAIFDQKAAEVAEIDSVIRTVVQHNCLPAVMHHCKLISEYVRSVMFIQCSTMFHF